MLVVVTGSNGFLGSRIARRFHEAGLETLGVSRSAGTGPWKWHQSDLTEPHTLLPPGWRYRDFTLVHLAWRTDRSPEFGDHAAHVAKLAGLLDYWRERGLSRVIVAGSAEEYGRRSGRLGETDPPQGPLSPYGWGKRGAYLLCQAWSGRSAVPVTWLRPFVVYGPHQSGQMVIPYAVRRALAGRPAEFSDGFQQRDFVYVDDVVEAFLTAARREGEGFEVANLGTGEPVAVRTLLLHLAKLLGPAADFRIGSIPRRTGEPGVQVADVTNAAALLEWKATVSWREGLDRLVEAERAAHRTNVPPAVAAHPAGEGPGVQAATQ